MATGDEVDRVAARAHSSAIALYGALMDCEAQCDDADIQAAAINGLLCAASQLLWRGRKEGSTPETIAGKVYAATLDIMRQFQARERPQ